MIFYIAGFIFAYILALCLWIIHFDRTFGPDRTTVYIGVAWAILPALIWPISVTLLAIMFVVKLILDKIGYAK